VSLKDAAARAAYMNVITKVVAAEDKGARADLAAAFKAERERTGTKSCDATLPGGQGIGSVTFVQPKAAAAVTDAEAFAKWVKAAYPSEVAGIRLVVDVQPAFLKRVLAEVTAAGVSKIVDKETGEIHDVPGVAVQGRAGYVRVTVPDDGEAAVMDALRTGGLAALVLPALAPAAEDAPAAAGGEA
jgi:hypothetical protein